MAKEGKEKKEKKDKKDKKRKVDEADGEASPVKKAKPEQPEAAAEATPKSEKKKSKADKEEGAADGCTPPGFNPAAISVIAKPLAEDKLCKKVLKLAKKGAQKKHIKRGVKEVVKALRKKTKGLCIIAGDISPIDVITHLPVLCEEHSVPYIYVPSKETLGAAGLTKRPTSCMLVLPQPIKGGSVEEDFTILYDEVFDKVKAVQPIF